MQGAGGALLPQPRPGMDELFANGNFLRLRNRVRQMYLHADDEGERITLRELGRDSDSPLSVVWRVHRANVGGINFILLQSAAHGRYLGVSPSKAPFASGYHGYHAVQRDYAGPEDAAALNFDPSRVVGDADYVLLRHGFNHRLRANGKHLHWLTGVTVESNYDRSLTSMMHWTVEVLQRAPELPPLLPTDPIANPEPRSRGRFWRRPRPEGDGDGPREIRHVRANAEGDFDPNHDNWSSFTFFGRSVFNLRVQVWMRQPPCDHSVFDITLAVRSGLHGRLTPLVADLPRNEDTMYIVAFVTGSQGAKQLVYPQIP